MLIEQDVFDKKYNTCKKESNNDKTLFKTCMKMKWENAELYILKQTMFVIENINTWLLEFMFSSNIGFPTMKLLPEDLSIFSEEEIESIYKMEATKAEIFINKRLLKVNN